MAATFTYDVFSSLDGFGSFGPEGDWGGYWGKQGPEFLEHRAAQYADDMRLVLGASTFRMFQMFLGDLTRESEVDDPINTRMKFAPTTVFSSTLPDAVDWPDAVVSREEPAEAVARMKAESDVPVRSHGSITLNRSLLAAGLIDVIQLTVFPALTGRTGTVPVFEAFEDCDLELIGEQVFDGRIVELSYRPHLH